MSFDNLIMPSLDQLKACGIRNPVTALKNLEFIRQKFGSDDFACFIPSILNLLATSADPDMMLNNLERFIEIVPDSLELLPVCKKYPYLLGAILTIFGASRFLSSVLLADPNALVPLLSDPAYLRDPAKKNYFIERLDSLLMNVQDTKEVYRILRTFRRQEMFRIGLRDLLGTADFSRTVAELSELARVCLEKVYAWTDAALRKKYGRPLSIQEDGTAVPAGFAVIAMGKLGGRELNFSSDIDLMYVYSGDGETEGTAGPDGLVSIRISNQQYFTKLAEKLTAFIGENTDDGFVFRVDLRLRPEGQRGPLVQSLDAYEIYYESWGQTWERAALLKARPVAGDSSTGKAFMQRISPFVYRKYLDYGAIAEIRDMKQKISRDVQQKGNTYRDVKLGYGGIREIEFVIQALQLMYSGRDRSLRENHALKALHALSQKGLITYQEQAELSRAYVFLRTIEHRIQILDDLQTQTLPADEPGIRALARRAGYLDPGKEAHALLEDYSTHTRKVRAIYDNLFTYASQEPGTETIPDEYAVLLDSDAPEQEAVSTLTSYGFRDPRKAYRNLISLREGPAFVHQTPRSRKQFNRIFPLILHEIIDSPDPDMALNHLESFLAAQGSWDAFQSVAAHLEIALKILVSIFSSSDYFSRLLIVSPQLLDDMLNISRAFGVTPLASFIQEIHSAMQPVESLSEKLGALRRFKHREEMRIGMADLISVLPPPVTSHALSRLAEACLGTALDLATKETSRYYGMPAPVPGLAVIGLGKLGGREITYGSDLDILFVFSEGSAAVPVPGPTIFEFFNKVAEKTISYMTAMTREGFLYRVDTRLRPGGSKGPLAQSISAFRNHYGSQAQTWESQVLINARFVAGDRTVGREFACSLPEMIYRKIDKPLLAEEVRAMRKRMENEIGKESSTHYNIKHGLGGLVDIEFTVQFLQLVHGNTDPLLRIPGTYNAVRALVRRKFLNPQVSKKLKNSYLFLRLIESRMRMVSNQSTSNLSRDPEKLRSLARRMGYRDDEVAAGRKLLNDYEMTIREIRAIYDDVVK